uniref:AlkZ-related protein n=1 Tax=Alloprevotella sp. TaxID=1872471 RepID=UPI004024F5BD
MQEKFHSCAQLIEYVQSIGILPLLSIKNFVGWSAEEVVDEECQYTKLPDGGWEWLLWEWKGEIIRESGCAYGKFFHGKAAFISQEWWPHYCNYRRSIFPKIEEGSIEETILEVLK